MAVLISVLSLVISIAIQGYRHVQQSRDIFIKNITASVDVIAYNLEPALVFDDKEEAKTIISGLSAQADVLSIALYKKFEQIDDVSLLLFISTASANATPTLFNGDELVTSMAHNRLRYQKPILSGRDLLGVIVIEAEITQLKNIIQEALYTAIMALLVTSSLALILALIISKKIIKPIQTLVLLTGEITKGKSFSVRSPHFKASELDRLGDSINQMLAIIEQDILQRKCTEVHIKELNLSLESKVKERTAQLASKNSELGITLQNLNDSREKLVEQEKMASLGELVAGVAHEINTPVGIGITATSHILDIVNKLASAVSDNKLSKSQFKQDLALLDETTRIALNNLERAAQLVQSFKLVAVDQASDEFRRFNLFEYIEEVIQSLKPQISRTQHKVHLQGEKNIVVYLQPGLIAQLISNMVMNSLNHAFDQIEQGDMFISVRLDGSRVKISYRDTGSGINSEDLSRLFMPFFTTKRGSGGSGLGTHIMYNIVNHALNGHIEASSELGKGLSYEIDFPINKDEP